MLERKRADGLRHVGSQSSTASVTMSASRTAKSSCAGRWCGLTLATEGVYPSNRSSVEPYGNTRASNTIRGPHRVFEQVGDFRGDFLPILSLASIRRHRKAISGDRQVAFECFCNQDRRHSCHTIGREAISSRTTHAPGTQWVSGVLARHYSHVRTREHAKAVRRPAIDRRHLGGGLRPWNGRARCMTMFDSRGKPRQHARPKREAILQSRVVCGWASTKRAKHVVSEMLRWRSHDTERTQSFIAWRLRFCPHRCRKPSRVFSQELAK